MSRFTIDFSDALDKDLESMRAQMGAGTKAEVIRKAIGYLKYSLEEQKKGGKLTIEYPQENRKAEIVTI